MSLQTGARTCHRVLASVRSASLEGSVVNFCRGEASPEARLPPGAGGKDFPMGWERSPFPTGYSACYTDRASRALTAKGGGLIARQPKDCWQRVQ